MLKKLCALFAIVIAVADAQPAAAQSIAEVTSRSGIRAWLVETTASEVVSLRFAFRGGSAGDPSFQSGVTALLASTLGAGAGKYDSSSFKTELELSGTKLSFSATRDAVFGNADLLVARLDRSCDLVGLALASPRFEENDFARARTQLLEQIADEGRDSRAVAEQTWYGEAFARHPYASSPIGSAADVARLERDDLESRHRALFARSALALVAVGPIGPAKLAEIIDRIFGALPAKSLLPKPAPLPQVSPGTSVTEHAELRGATIVFGATAVPRKHADFPALLVANRILGGGQLDSRLSRAVRDRRGLAYSAATSIVSDSLASIVLGEVETEPGRTAEAVEVIANELQRAIAGGLQHDEVEAAKRFLIGAYAISLDSNAALAEALLSANLDDFTPLDVAERGSRISAVSDDDVNRAASRAFDPARTLIVVATPVPKK